MAFRNYIFPGSYALIKSVIYNKQDRIVICDLDIYQDNTKSNLVTTMKIELFGTAEVLRVDEIRDTNPQEDNHDEGYRILYKVDVPTGEERENQIHYWDANGLSNCIQPYVNQTVFHEASDTRLSWNGSIWVEANEWDHFDSEVFDKYFSIQKMQEAGGDALKVVYDYLKVRPDFAGVIDT